MKALTDTWHKLSLYFSAAWQTRSINWRGLPLLPKWSKAIPTNRASYNVFLLWLKQLQLKTPRVIFDIGANHGVFAQAVSACFPEATVFLFEPLPRLRASLVSQSLRYPGRWRFYPTAMGATEGRLPLYADRSDDGIASFVGFSDSYSDSYSQSRNRLPGTQQSETIEVPVDTLDEFCRREGIYEIDLLKIDVEGFEFSVLDGAKEMLAKTSSIIVETSLIRSAKGKPTPLMDMISRLTTHEFYVIGLFPSFTRDEKKQNRPCEYNVLARRF
ncbi:MAG TPA: FkbM family methyltransferase [Chthoniobacterales bacterium]|nr:FkbM family methyltransferase [Chthoniobacterales bacterium]